MSNLEVIVTSGSIVSWIDDIRFIGNFSKGTTAARIAEEFLKSGAFVHYIYGTGARKPFRQDLVMRPEKSLEEEIERLKKAREEYEQFSGNLREYQADSFEAYTSYLHEVLQQKPVDVVVLAAAVGDYGMDKQPGKISSNLETLDLKLRRNLKVISEIKKIKPEVFQVGFKLLYDAKPDELIETAYKHGLKNHSDLTVANSVSGQNLSDRITYIITPEKGIIPVSVEELANVLVDTVERRCNVKHYSTCVTNYNSEKQVFKEEVQRLRKLNLFEPYYEGSDAQFGFLAKKLKKGFLITARASNKKELSDDDIVYVEAADHYHHILYVTSSGKKASMNANLAARIFQYRYDINYIVHSHVSLSLENRTLPDYPPGTQEDVDEVMKYLADKNAVELKNHGIMIIGKDLESLTNELLIEPAYTRFPQYYDIIYHRFQKSNDFVNLVTENVDKKADILDLAAGTGDVAEKLAEKGYSNISISDKNVEMLEVAKQKMKEAPCYAVSIENMDLNKTFDAILIRQAINYLMDYQSLVQGLKNIRRHLKEEGRLIFNAPNFNDAKDYCDKHDEYEVNDYVVKVHEMNLVDGRILTHTRRCELYKKDGTEVKKLYDINRFGLFTKDDFEKALEEAGFSNISFYGKNLEHYRPESKTIYCIAKK